MSKTAHENRLEPCPCDICGNQYSFFEKLAGKHLYKKHRSQFIAARNIAIAAGIIASIKFIFLPIFLNF
jgi:hypothetical protein